MIGGRLASKVATPERSEQRPFLGPEDHRKHRAEYRILDAEGREQIKKPRPRAQVRREVRPSTSAPSRIRQAVSMRRARFMRASHACASADESGLTSQNRVTQCSSRCLGRQTPYRVRLGLAPGSRREQDH